MYSNFYYSFANYYLRKQKKIMKQSVRYTKQTNDFIKTMKTISKWAKSCETKEQLNNVEKFLDNFVSKTKKPVLQYENETCHIHWGIVLGIIFTVKKFKINN